MNHTSESCTDSLLLHRSLHHLPQTTDLGGTLRLHDVRRGARRVPWLWNGSFFNRCKKLSDLKNDFISTQEKPLTSLKLKCLFSPQCSYQTRSDDPSSIQSKICHVSKCWQQERGESDHHLEKHALVPHHFLMPGPCPGKSWRKCWGEWHPTCAAGEPQTWRGGSWWWLMAFEPTIHDENQWKYVMNLMGFRLIVEFRCFQPRCLCFVSAVKSGTCW